ncbi:MAG: DNA cytosine methyltransferase [Ktedonobacterales bacterium]|nr:DNA cytosine methyltransferase [Ktedonobacterales bacterium]
MATNRECPPTVPAPPARLRGFDAFCGAGGFSLGFLLEGYEVLGALDRDAAAAITYLANLGATDVAIHSATPADAQRLQQAVARQFPKGLPSGAPASAQAISGMHRPAEILGVRHFFFGDVRVFDPTSMLGLMGVAIGDLDVVFGGPPCQGFSTSGRRQVLDPRNSLVFEFARLVVAFAPRTFVLENVPGMLAMVTPEGIPVVDALAHIFAEGGFGTYDALRRLLAQRPEAQAVFRASPIHDAATASAPTIPDGAPPLDPPLPQQRALF